MPLNRRDLLKISIASSVAVGLTGCSLLPRKASGQPDSFVGAVGLRDGSFGVSAFDRSGSILWQTPVETRCHSGCNRPRMGETVFFERRPGWSFYVFDSTAGSKKHRIEAEAGEHFVGHGVFSMDGRWLYVTASRYEQAEGIIAVYDAERGYLRTDTFGLTGIGPHELTLHPDGETLVIGLGGILSHPDYNRMKLNLDTMDPALLLMDRHFGNIVGRFKPPHHHQSARHVSVSGSGRVYVAYQHQGPLYETPSLLAQLEKGQLREYRFDEDTQRALANYIASVVAHPENDLVAAASPVGSTAIIFRGSTGELVNCVTIADCAGIQAIAGGDFLVSSGRGKLVRLGAGRTARELADLPVHWDHHLV
ncbi:hypothetical protein SAMN04487881_1611 [Marinobacter sp. es.048]|uniref:DUF1513 domain-containing protein n=1 Tax=Marinobacter sp. es.048 TaxID=1761795 RepID=UPI000B58A5A1|nr:DUF1513 domain-containing protein [Marinobacter sp. es.048]SNC66449.1 hypothetical protein SAMN04487881_1611 [Marinobacter sp. es.048]